MCPNDEINQSADLPACCSVQQDCAGGYEVAHLETSIACTHTPSGGTSGRPDGKTKCNRIIGRGRTETEAIQDALEHLDVWQ